MAVRAEQDGASASLAPDGAAPRSGQPLPPSGSESCSSSGSVGSCCAPSREHRRCPGAAGIVPGGPAGAEEDCGGGAQGMPSDPDVATAAASLSEWTEVQAGKRKGKISQAQAGLTLDSVWSSGISVQLHT
uniref:Uncharacterized protein n=2 Tax=Alexandrium monilatum TaxID=311494 RepID=A0A7S4UEJ2_9DINO